jgi:phosphoenolpyruvate-protein phosphotransferase (PTS system enzyme I)
VAARFGESLTMRSSAPARGIPASPASSSAPVHLLRWEVPEVPQRIIAPTRRSTRRSRAARGHREGAGAIAPPCASAPSAAGPEEAAIFDVQVSMLEDAELLQAVESLIRQNLAAEKAFDIVLLEWRSTSRAAHAMLRERVGDLTDVHIRVLSLLLGLPDHDPVDVPKGAGAILVTHDLTPSLTVQLDREAIAGIATDAGTRTSHVAILARSLGLPAVVGLRDAGRVLKRRRARRCSTATSGTLTVTPHRGERRHATRRRAIRRATEELREAGGGEAVTPTASRRGARQRRPAGGGGAAALSGAEGVGLMRTEFLVVGRATCPTRRSSTAPTAAWSRPSTVSPVIIRTYDIGGDKLPVGGFPHEPTRSWAGARSACASTSPIFKVQLRALLRAAMHGDVRIMLPLVVTVDEVREARALLGRRGANSRSAACRTAPTCRSA